MYAIAGMWLMRYANISKKGAFTKSVDPDETPQNAASNPRGGTLISSHIRRLGPFFWVQNSEFQYFFGFSEK